VRYTNKVRERDGREPVAPLYTEQDAQNVFPLLETVAYNQTIVIEDGIELMYTDCGHILGSAAINLKLHENGQDIRITFSGDIGRYSDLILRSPDVFPQADFIIMESTYGDKLHDLNTIATEKILETIKYTCLEKKGKLIIPAFSLGRTQELLYILNRLELERRLPDLNYYVDSPLSIAVTEIIKRNTACFNRHVQKLLEKDEDVFMFKGLKYIRDVEDSIALNASDDPCVIISASGMAEAGRVKHHISHTVSNTKNTIMFSGYCEPHSLGGKLKDGAKQVKMFSKLYDVKAEITSIDTLSAHGDYEDLSQWLACQDSREVRKIFLVHGEYDTQINFRERLIRKGYTDVEIPDLHQTIGLGI